MSKHRFTLEVEVDDEALAEEVKKNGGNAYPCTVDPDDWYDVDLTAALEKGIAEFPEEGGITNYERMDS